MGLQLFSVEHMPRAIPVWATILDDLGRPPADRIAKALGVGRTTVFRWTADDSAPRVACLALFWLTRWGRSQINAQATRDAVTAVSLVRALSEERDRLARQLEVADRENRDLQYDLASTQLAATGRGSAATAGEIRTGTEPEGSSEAGGSTAAGAPGSQGLAWPRLEPAAPWPQVAWTPERQAAAARTKPATGHQGSPEGQPPGAHSARCPATGHRPPPPSSAGQGSGLLSPLTSDRCQSEAIMASSATVTSDAALTCFRWDKPTRAGAAPAGCAGRHERAPRRLGSSSTAPGRPPAPAAQAQGGASLGFPGTQAPAAAHGPPDPRHPSEVPNHGQASPDPSASGSSQLRGLNGPSHGAMPHTPAPSAPGSAVFAALVRSATADPAQPSPKGRTRQ